MGKKYNLSFIASRIKEIGSGLMHDLGTSHQKIPADIVTVLKTDDQGYLWFFIRKPFAVSQDIPISFPASLQFLRKGKNFFIKLTGVARSTGNYNQVSKYVNIDNLNLDSALTSLTLIEMRINSVEYCEYDAEKPRANFTSRFMAFVRNIFSIPNYSHQSMARTTLN